MCIYFCFAILIFQAREEFVLGTEANATHWATSFDAPADQSITFLIYDTVTLFA